MRKALLELLAPMIKEQKSSGLERLSALWPLLVTGEFATKSSPVALAGNDLTVEVASAAVGQELSLASRSIMARLNAYQSEYGWPRLRTIRTRAAPPGRFASSSDRSVGTRPPVAGRISSKIADELESVDDSDLRMRLERLARHRR